MTKGEVGLQLFCKRNAIAFRRISESEERTPDYELTIGVIRVIAEVKDIELNEEEKDVQEKMKIGQMRSWGSKLGSRVRDAINKANKQIKKLTLGKIPGILVLFDTRPWPFNILYSYEIKVAMYGFETYDFSISKDFSPPTIVGRRFGEGQKCTPSHNTSTSAVAVLELDKQSGAYKIVIYHNKHSAAPLSPNCWENIDAVRQFVIKQNVTDEFGEWESI